MNLVIQFKGFRTARTQRPLNAHAIALYHALLEEANEAYFPEWLCLANGILEGRAGLSASAMRRARESLAENGYIEYTEGGRSRAPKYRIVPLSAAGFQDTVQNEPQSEPQSEQQSDSVQDSVQDGVQDGVQNGGQNEPQTEHLYKQDLTDKDNINNNTMRVRAYECYEQNIGLLSGVVAEAIQSYLDDGVEDGMVCAAIEDAALNNVRKWAYVNKILSEKLNSGIKTLAAYNREKTERGRGRDRPPEVRTASPAVIRDADDVFESWKKWGDG